MKRFLSIAIALFFCSVTISAQNFITKWTFGSPATSISFNAQTAGGAVNYTWTASPSGNSGSGSFTKTTAGAVTLSGLTIVAGDDVILTIQPANLRRFYTYIDANTVNYILVDVMEWGNVPWTSMDGAFYGCTNLNVSATDIPNLTAVTSMQRMFGLCKNLVGNSTFNSWNTTSVTNMASMFVYATLFNQPIGNWNTGNVTNMASMFADATKFNQPIGNWNTAKVTNMSSMFFRANVFNQPVGNWNTANVTNMSSMFAGAWAFNQDVSNWNTGKVTNMSKMFSNCNVFNQPIGNWDVSKVTNMSSMFIGAFAFNQDISGWNTANVTTMQSMFENAFIFNQDIGNWDVSKVTNMNAMFSFAGKFNKPIGNWNTGNVQNMKFMFSATIFNQDISSWNTGKVVTMASMFEGAKFFNQNIGGWNTATVTDMSFMFSSATAFNQDISGWNTATVTYMNYMFYRATAFNQNIGNWTLRNNVDLGYMLNECGMDCNNYSATLSGWLGNNPTVTGRYLGATGRTYGTDAAPIRTTLTGTQGWTIIGDAPASAAPYILTPSNSIDNIITAVTSCGYYVNPTDNSQKIMQFDANGNTFNPAKVKISNTGFSYSPGGTIDFYVNMGTGTAYSQMVNGANTMRVGWRMHTIEAPGTYTTNGGIRVRVYYNQNDIDAIKNEPVPGNPLTSFSWFKSSRHDAAEVFQDMDYSTLTLKNAKAITPIATGTENGVAYAEFLLTSFSTIGYYAGTQLIVLPVTLTSFDVRTQDCIVKLNWQTAEEINFSRFEIERSIDGINYSTISTVAANGDNSSYSFTDNNAKEGKNIYRLKMTDNDGKYKYSSLKLVMLNCNGNKSVVIYPNPASDNINISLSGYTGKVQGRLFNNIGQLIKTTLLVNGTNTIPVNGFAKGVYNLVITDEAGKVISYKVVVN